MKVLQIVDGDKNPMGFLYEAIDRAKEAIQHLYRSNDTKYRPIRNISDRRWHRQLHQHIHAAAYFLNPKYYFSNTFKANAEVQIGLDICIGTLVADTDLRDLILDELQSYKREEGPLSSSPDCKRSKYTLQPSKKEHVFSFIIPFISLVKFIGRLTTSLMVFLIVADM